MMGMGKKQHGKREPDDHEDRVPLDPHGIDQLAGERNCGRARQRGEHVNPAEITVAEPQFLANATTRQRDIEGLPVARKQRQQKSASKPAGIVTKKMDEGHEADFRWNGSFVMREIASN